MFKIKGVRKLLEDAIKLVITEDWQKCVAHAERLQEEDFVKEGLRDERIQSIVMNLREDSDDSSSSSDEECSEDDDVRPL